MKLEKFTKNKKEKRIIIGSIIILFLLIGGITLYRTFALYEEKKEFNVLKGRVPNFLPDDIEFAVYVNGTVTKTIPEKGNYLVDVNCDTGTGKWDYSKWSVVVKDFQNGTKCDVSFTPTTADKMPNIPNLEIEDLELVYEKSGSLGSTTTILYTASEYEYLLCLGTTFTIYTSTGLELLNTGQISAGGAHKYSVAIFKLSKGDTISGYNGMGDNRIYKIK